MLTFLRKIRKSLIESGSTRKYLLYAVGEILLVMIGILLALQVNNWNEQKKANQKEAVYLDRLHTDLKKDDAYINRRMQDSQQEIASYYDLIHQSRNIQNTIQEFRELMAKGYYSSEQLSLNNSTYTELINTGNIELITNDSLKIGILDLYKHYDAVAKHVEEINLFSSSVLRKESEVAPRIKYQSFASRLFDNEAFFHPDDWQWINNPSSLEFRLMEETVAIYHFKHNVFKSYFEQLLPEIESLSQLIEQELGQ